MSTYEERKRGRAVRRLNSKIKRASSSLRRLIRAARETNGEYGSAEQQRGMARYEAMLRQRRDALLVRGDR